MSSDAILNAILAAATLLGLPVAVIQLQKWYREWQETKIDTFDSIERDAIILRAKILSKGFNPDFVLALGRSGAFLGGWLAGNLGALRIEVLDRKHLPNDPKRADFPHGEEKIEFLKRIYPEKAKVLVVEGATETGVTFLKFHDLRTKIAPDWECKYCLLYDTRGNTFPTDFVAKQLKAMPKDFQWQKFPEYVKAPTAPVR